MCCGGEGGRLMLYHSVTFATPCGTPRQPHVKVILVAMMKCVSRKLPREFNVSCATSSSSDFDDMRETKLCKGKVSDEEVRHDRMVRHPDSNGEPDRKMASCAAIDRIIKPISRS